MTTQIEAVQQNPDLTLDALRRMARVINQLVLDANRRATEHTQLSTTTTVTLDDNYTCVFVDASGGAKTINLPAAASYKGRFYTIKKIDSSGNAVTIDGNGAETIDGAATASITMQYMSRTIFSTGTQWWII